MRVGFNLLVTVYRSMRKSIQCYIFTLFVMCDIEWTNWFFCLPVFDFYGTL